MAGPRRSNVIELLLLAVAIIDDLLAIGVITIFCTEELSRFNMDLRAQIGSSRTPGWRCCWLCHAARPQWR